MTLEGKSSKVVAAVLVAIAVGLTALRLFLAASTPLLPAMGQLCDDALLAGYADTIQGGEWLGTFESYTLAKRPGYALFLTLPSVTGVPYQVLFVGLQVVGALAFAIAIRPIVRSRIMRLVAYLSLLYLPALFSWDFFQRVYRMGIVIPYVLILCSCYIAMYLRKEEGALRLAPWVLLASPTMAIFYVTKEDSIWIVPFVLVVSLILLGSWVAQGVRGVASIRSVAGRGCLLVVPAICTMLLIAGIGQQNFDHYGERTLCERSDGAFSQAMSKLVQVYAPDCDHVIWVSRASMKDAILCSAGLQSIEEQIWQRWQAWAGDEELGGDLTYWALLEAFSTSGRCGSGADSEAFWTQVSEELDAALRDGRLRKKPGLRIASSVQPVQAGDVGWWVHDSLRNIVNTFNLSRMDAVWGTGGGDLAMQERVRELAKGPVLITGDEDKVASYDWVLSSNRAWIRVCATASAPLALLMVAELALVAFLAFAQGDAQARKVLLIVAGLLLTTLELVVAVTWFISFLSEPQWPAYAYSAGLYPLVGMAMALLTGFCMEWLWGRRTARHEGGVL